MPRQFSHYNVAYAGTLAGIANAQPGRNVQVKPFVGAQVARGAMGRHDWDARVDGGLDVKWGLKSSFVLDGSWRTDFSQVEADEQQINLTRFNQFSRRSVSSSSRALPPFKSALSKTTGRIRDGIWCPSSAGASVCRPMGGPFQSSAASA